MAIQFRIPHTPKKFKQTCTTFNEYPTELHLLIWEAVKHTPQIICIDQTTGYFMNGVGETTMSLEYGTVGLHNEKYRVRCSNGVPALMYTTSVSRSIALRTYKLSFASIDHRPKYIDFSKDTLQLRGCYTNWLDAIPNNSSLLEELGQVRHLIITNPTSTPNWYNFFVRYLDPFDRLEYLAIPPLEEFENRLMVASNCRERLLGKIYRYWKEEKNAKQREKGLPLTRTPKLVFLNGYQVAKLENFSLRAL